MLLVVTGCPPNFNRPGAPPPTWPVEFAASQPKSVPSLSFRIAASAPSLRMNARLRIFIISG